MTQVPDTKPGNYYVTAISGEKVAWLLGPFVNDHGAALGMVDAARAKACDIDPRAHWYSFGTARAEHDFPGKLNGLLQQQDLPAQAKASAVAA